MLEVNGEKRDHEPGQTLGGLLMTLGIQAERVVIEHNGGIPDRSQWDHIPLMSGDRVEIVRFMGGG